MFPPNTPGATPEIDNAATLRADMDLLNQDDTPATSGEPEETEVPDSTDEPEVDDATDEAPEGTEPETELEPEVEGKDDKAPKPDDAFTLPRPTYKEITSKYPNFFKDFPDMRHMMFREGEYTTLFPTVDDAKEAQVKASDFENLATLVNSGKTDDFQEFLGGVAKGGQDSLHNMAANFLPALYKTNQDMYFAVTTPIVESIIRAAYRTAEESGNQDLMNSALHMAKFALNNVKFATGELKTPPLQPKVEAKDPKLEKDKAEYYSQRYQEIRSFVSTTSQTKLRAEIRKGLDPNGVFGEFTTGQLMKEIYNKVGEVMEADTRHMAVMNSLWNQAAKAGYVGNWRDRILTTYLSRARAAMPAVRAQLRNAALKDLQGGEQTREERATRSADRRDIAGSAAAPNGGRSTPGKPVDSRAVDWSKTSDLDFLNDRVSLKK